ncbi:glycosyltransferase family 4 protein [Mycobacterium deserti]|uniref:Glycosyltransferase family 4 protein n=1 Tax=Mycobacterium deserti TaxID=2978347 RepID=A0ABT2MD15_9MYCO|nr:glycosyltransferase family 4 protein [Mycobacterium deserti]MCT7660162.1 glycosyltransferase family 4 protein [Mycobacterium deserti]
MTILPLRVMMIGPAPAGPKSRGGMATVAALMAQHPDSRFEVAVVPTFVDAAAWQRLSVGVCGMLRGTWAVLRGRVDLVHVHLSHGGSVVRKALPLLAARHAGVPAVIHGHSFDFGGWFDGLPQLAQRVVPAVLPADRWLVLGSSHVVEYQTRLGIPADRIQVLHNAIPLPEHAVPQTASERVHAVMVGRLGERKGSYDVVAAVAALDPDIRRRLRVTLAGDGEIDGVAAAVAAAGLSDTIHIAGWLDERSRDDLLASAQIFLLPSRDEGLPMALLEAMAWGLAPITSTAGSIGEVITDGVNGLLVDAGRRHQIAAALRTLVTDAPMRARLGSAAREHATDFSLNRWYEQLATVWTSLAATFGRVDRTPSQRPLPSREPVS